LRSRKTNSVRTRMDVLFQDVRAMEIRAWFDGIEIYESSPDILTRFPSNPGKMLEIGNKVYGLKGSGWSGYIVGGIFRTHEDDREMSEPSPLLVGEILNPRDSLDSEKR